MIQTPDKQTKQQTKQTINKQVVIARDPNAPGLKNALNATNKSPDTLSEANILAQAEKTNPALVKYLKRVFKEGVHGLDAVREAMRRFEEARKTENDSLDKALVFRNKPEKVSRDAPSNDRAYHNADREILALRRTQKPGLWADEGFSSYYGGYLGKPLSAEVVSMSSPLAGLINSLPTIMKNPKYHDYYLANMGHSLPIPYAATDSIANKTIGVRASVSEAITVPPGHRYLIMPSPDHFFNAPYVLIDDVTNVPMAISYGKWYGGISPQALVGTPPSLFAGKAIDDRSLQFKGGLAEVNVSVAYNQSCVVAHLDPFATLGYGMAMGLLQELPSGQRPGTSYSAQPREFPYFAEAKVANDFDGIQDLAVKTTLIGSSSASGVAYRQIIRPYAHGFTCAVEETTDLPSVRNALPYLGYPQGLLNATCGDIVTYAQGIYMIDNKNGTSAVAVDLKMEMAYRVRVDNSAPAIYMSADSDTVPKHSIEFKPVTAIASSVAAASSLQRSGANARAVVPAINAKPASPNHLSDAVSTMKHHEPSIIGKISEVVGHVPVVGGGVAQALRGGEKIATAGDAGDVFAGLLDVGRGVGSAVAGIFGL